MAKSFKHSMATEEDLAKYKGKTWFFTLPPEQAQKLSEMRAKRRREAEKKAEEDSKAQ